MLPPRPEALLTFSFADCMPAGDMVLKALADQLQHEKLSHLGEALLGRQDSVKVRSPTSASSLSNAGSPTAKASFFPREEAIAVGEVLIGEPTVLERAVLHSRDNNKKVELAKASIDGVKLDGIGTNIAVMKVSAFDRLSHYVVYHQFSPNFLPSKKE